jgi:hypothetical protein
MDSQCFAKDAANPAVTDNNFLVLQTVIVLSFRQRHQFSPGPPKARGRRVRTHEAFQRENQWWRTTSGLTAIRVKGPIATPLRQITGKRQRIIASNITPRRRHGLFHPTAVEVALVGCVLFDVRSLSLLGNILRFRMLD